MERQIDSSLPTGQDNVAVNEEFLLEKATPREFLMKYMHYVPLFIICIIGSFALSFIYLYYANPIYKTGIEILIKEDDDQNGGSLSNEILSKLFSNGKANISNELEIIKSETLMENVVKKLSLNQIFYVEGSINTKEVYDSAGKSFIHFDNIFDSSLSYLVNVREKNNNFFLKTAKGWAQIQNNVPVRQKGFQFTFHNKSGGDFVKGRNYIAIWQPVIVAAEGLSKRLDIKQLNKEATIIQLSIKTEVKQKGEDILNSIAEAYSQLNIDEKNRVNKNTIHFLDDRIAVLNGELTGIENDLQQYREKNNIISPETQVSGAFTSLRVIKDRMDETQVKMQVADMIKSYVNDPGRKFNLVPSSLGFEDVTLIALVRAYNSDVLMRENLLKSVTLQNNDIKKAEDRLVSLQNKIIESVDNIKKTLQSTYTTSKIEYDGINAQIGTVPEKERTILGKSRQQEIKEKLYVYLLEKKEQSAINEASAISNNYPVDPAFTETTPVSPNETAIYSLATVLGLGLPSLIIYLVLIFNDKVVTRRDITRYTRAPIIGEINHTEGKERRIVSDKSRGILSEQFRNLRTNLQYFKKSDDKQSVLVTSSMPGEGKSFVSMNIGAVFAATGRKTIIVELDLRKPKLSSALNIENDGKGLTSYLVGSLEIDDIIKPIVYGNTTNYFILPSGPIPPNPSELILDPKLSILFAELKKRFDYVIIDTPPIGIVSDARVLAKFSDVNVYIVRQRYTVKRQLKLVNDIYEGRVLNNMCIVVNDVVHKGASSYYGYGGYGYGYGYSGYSYNYTYGYGYGYGNGGQENDNLFKKIGRFFSPKKNTED